MTNDVLKKEQTSPIVMQTDEATPVVSLFVPFEPKMINKTELVYKLHSMVKEAEQKLIKNYSFSAAEPVLQRLKAVIKNLDYSTHKKSVAMYVSAKSEKLFYLDTLLKEKVLVDTSFNIRSLVDSKKSLQQHLVLVLGNNISRVYFSNGVQLVSMFTSTRKKDESECAASLEKFLQQTDNNLNIIINYFPLLPVFVVGNTYILNKYKIVTKKRISHYAIDRVE